MQRISLGDRAKSITIQRSNCADNVPGRAVLIDPNPAVKQIAWLSAVKDGQEIKRGVEVNQEQAIALGAIPRVTYFFLIARLNTDLKGNVIGEDIQVEYLQLSANVYEEFCNSAQELENFNHILLNKVVRKPGDTYGYVKPTASQKAVSKGIMEKIRKMQETEGFVESMWKMIDNVSSISYEEWCNLIGSSDETPSRSSSKQIASKKETKRIEKPTMQVSPEELGKDFENDDFSDEPSDFGDDNDFN